MTYQRLTTPRKQNFQQIRNSTRCYRGTASVSRSSSCTPFTSWPAFLSAVAPTAQSAVASASILWKSRNGSIFRLEKPGASMLFDQGARERSNSTSASYSGPAGYFASTSTQRTEDGSPTSSLYVTAFSIVSNRRYEPETTVDTFTSGHPTTSTPSKDGEGRTESIGAQR